MSNGIKLLSALPSWVQKSMWKSVYQGISSEVSDEVTFLNWGFSSPEMEEAPIALEEQDEPFRYHINLYHHLASSIPMEGVKVLEIGCGRGGGASFVKRYMKPVYMAAVDLSKKAIDFAKSKHAESGVRFEIGDAEKLRFPDNSFDVVMNVESSHCYGSMNKFLKEVTRVLKVGGHFLFVDVRMSEFVETLKTQLNELEGFEVISSQDISKNILRGIELDSERRLEVFNAMYRDSSEKKRKRVLNFSAVEGSDFHQSLKSGKQSYLSYILKKG
jgi:ubiquinone/menaquinone biosynthesis C-methylase UbiE